MKALLIIAAAIGAPLLAICLRVGQRSSMTARAGGDVFDCLFIAAMGVAVVPR